VPSDAYERTDGQTETLIAILRILPAAKQLGWLKREISTATVDHTSPALCTPITPFPVDPICSDRVNDGMIPSAV